MKAYVLLVCLVIIRISTAAETHDKDNGLGIQLRKRTCRNIGGRCIKKTKSCPEDLYLETLLGKPFCKRNRRCCYPESPTIDPGIEKVVCGLEAVPSTRIVNGKDSREYPWQVGLSKTGSPQTDFFCGGTFITKMHILTAAHCFNVEKTATKPCHEDIPKMNQVYVGYGSIKENKAKTIRADSVTIHGNYICETSVNDITVVKLHYSIDEIIPICLPIDSSDDQKNNGIIMGWGSTVGYNPTVQKPPKYPNVLQKSKVPIISNTLCNTLVKGGIKSTQMCTSTGKGYNGDPKGSGTCQGDSGGPLVVGKTGKPKQYVQVGITSYGYGCASKNNPDVLTRVSKFLDFIENNTGQETLYYIY